MQVSSILKNRIKAISKSGFFHSTWYLAAYPDVEALGMTPVEHYLRFGDMMGRSPGASFDAQFYRQIYGDFIQPGETALESYLRVEREAGRLPRKIKPQLRMARRLSRHMWGGCVLEATEKLEAISCDPGSGRDAVVFALCQLAARRHFDGDLDGAAACLNRIPRGTSDRAFSSNGSLMRAMVALEMGDVERAQTAMEGNRTWRAGDRVLAASLLEEDDEARLNLLSRAYYDDSMIGLARRDPRAPLTIDNLRGDAVLPRMPSIGTVSVIIPAYKSEASLEMALRSLLEQSYPDLEILVVDDCSPDGTHEVARRVAQEDARVRPLRMPRNAGAYPARNYGLQQATGAFITTHDADDWSHPQKIEWQLRTFLHNPDLQATAVHWARCRHDLRFTTNWRLEDRIMHWSYSSFMMRREAAKTLGPWDEVRSGADTEMVWRFIARYGEAAFMNVHSAMPLAFALDDAGSLTRSKASHVVTNYHGLRLLYREVSRYHLAVEGAGTEAAAAQLTPPGHGRFGSPADKMARVPVEMWGGTVDETLIDLVIEVDLFDAAQVDRTVAFLRGRGVPGKTGLLHTPGIESDARRFAPALWEVLDGERVVLLVPGLYKNGGKARLAVADLPDETDPPPESEPALKKEPMEMNSAPADRKATQNRHTVRYAQTANPQNGHAADEQVASYNLPVANEVGPMILARRTDGFGERMKAMVNAIVVAEIYGGHFKFAWPLMSKTLAPGHVVRSPDETFSSDYIACHEIDFGKARSSTMLSANNIEFPAPDAGTPFTLPSDVSGIVIEQSHLPNQIGVLKGQIDKDAYQKAFETIAFAPPLEAAKQEARAISINDDSWAIHLRAGDIVYGIFRETGRYVGKTMPYVAVEEIISQIKAKGGDVILFGQDEGLCQSLADKHKIIWASALAVSKGFDNLQTALFEISLMARCRNLIAGSSGFAAIANMIGQSKKHAIDTLISNEELAKLILADAARDQGDPGISNLQRSHGYLYALVEIPHSFSLDQKITLLERAQTLDPENPFFSFLSAIFQYDAGNDDEAERTLDRSYAQDGSLEKMLRIRHQAQITPATPYLEILQAAANRGLPTARKTLSISLDAVS